MAQTIKPKRKTSVGAIVAGDLQVGEVSLEEQTRSLFFKDSGSALRLANGARSVVTDAITYAHTGTLTETILQSYLVRADSLIAGSVLDLDVIRTKTGTASTTTIKIYRNSTASLSGATLLATFSAFSTLQFITFSRRFILAGGVLIGYPAATSNNDDNNCATSFLSTAFSPTVDNYFISTETLVGSTADTVTQRLFRLTETR